MIKGTGGHGRKKLQGRGPTPKAEDRSWHPAGKRKAAAERREAAKPKKKLPAHLSLPKDHEIIAGRNPVYEAVTAGIPLLRVFLAPGTKNDERLAKVLRTATALGAPMLEVTKSELDMLSEGATHQGIAIEVPPYEYADFGELLADALESGEAPLFVALDQVTDPHNLGAVLRSAGAFGAHGVIVPERRSAGVNATAWKVSAGAAARVPVAQVTNLVRALQDAKAAGCFVAGLAGGTSETTATFDLATSPLVLVTGSEGTGLSRLVTDTCDQLVSIPISPAVESLNAAVATGIALYDVRRRREAES
ncbi:23S rRNA (guanosine(2251)-2'-O)-methyltransferase RlmB [Bowdeniella nasicola]|uniref:23S rRNA (Guanosine(2251)-2'-O)-methyltransferase RlmB n=1 Tax=Bowdeniella nasicola TaxID=208480 RepID=A0A1Q5Q0S5_9ACTO|nr:23S rRNA (guanosine(2251)-2'-O)-methyltransferase RlmB [Bowdeniella nasicola]OKL53356.1 23S rRNA (guanosine(2251)-2'-O)-methyltransferase RlmB [Bowdeniella nasicola]